MKINLSKEQYKDLLHAVSIAHTMTEMLNDSRVNDISDYQERIFRLGDLEQYLLEFAGECEGEKIAQELHGGLYMDEKYYEKEIEPVFDDFEEVVLEDALPNILAWRDFNKDYSAEEQEQMSFMNGDFFANELFPYEEYYRNEFAENGMERLFVVKENGENGMLSPYL